MISVIKGSYKAIVGARAETKSFGSTTLTTLLWSDQKSSKEYKRSPREVEVPPPLQRMRRMQSWSVSIAGSQRGQTGARGA